MSVENIVFISFGIHLYYKSDEDHTLAECVISFNIIGTFIIFFTHLPIDVIMKYLDFYSDEKQEFYVYVLNISMDIFVWIPNTVFLCYYMFWTNDPYYIATWYVAIVIFMLYGIFRMAWLFFEQEENCIDFIEYYGPISIYFIKISGICCIMATVYLCVTDKAEYKVNTFRFVISIIFISIGGIPWCCVGSFCVVLSIIAAHTLLIAIGSSIGGVGYGVYWTGLWCYDKCKYGDCKTCLNDINDDNEGCMGVCIDCCKCRCQYINWNPCLDILFCKCCKCCKK